MGSLEEYSQKTIDVYNAVAEQYAHTRNGKKKWEQLLLAIHEHTPLDGKVIVDLGAGSCRVGQFCIEHQILPSAYIPVDQSVMQLQIGLSWLDNAAFPVVSYVQNLDKPLPIQGDVVFALAVYQHLLTQSAQDGFWKQLAHILPPGGICLMTQWQIEREKYREVEENIFSIPFGNDKSNVRYYKISSDQEIIAAGESVGLDVTRFMYQEPHNDVYCIQKNSRLSL